jgi:TonB family protein
MKLAGDLAEFSLADLVQVAGVAGRVCCIRVMAAEGNGVLYLDNGEVVGAAYENLAGFDAFTGLVAARAGHFQVEDGAAPEARTPLGGVQRLLLEANARIESGRVPQPRKRVMPAGAGAAPGRPPAAGQGHAPSLWIGGGAVALLLLGALSWLALARHDVAARAGGAPQAAATPAEPALEAAQLTAAGDAVPVLAVGRPPVAPDPGAVLKPTIVCRLLVDSSGRVADAKIYRSRLDLASFEDAALDAARQYRFIPGRRAGKPVAVWINWPLSFR